MKPARQAPALRSVVRRLAEVHARDAAESETGDRTLDVVASDETIDRYGDVVSAAGWQLAEFAKNPIALWMHSYDAPIGNVEDVRVEGTRLLARIRFAAAGVSERVDELWRLVKAGVLRAVSVGFTVDSEADYEYIRDEDENVTGFRFLRQQLLEVSLVTVPANPNALALAKSLCANPRVYLHEDSQMEPTEQPAGALRPIERVPSRLSDALPQDLAAQLERSPSVRLSIARSLRDLPAHPLREQDIAGVLRALGVPPIAAPQVLAPVSLYAPFQPMLFDLVPSVSVSGGSVVQNRIDYGAPNNNAAALVPDGSPKPESTLVATATTLAMATWAHWIEVTLQALADVPSLRALIDSILTLGLREKVSNGVFATMTTAGNFTPFAGSVAGETVGDGIARAAAQLAAVGGSGITAAVNPADLLGAQLAKAEGSGIYLGMPPGLNAQIVGAPQVPAGQVLAWASQFGFWANREEVNVMIGLIDKQFTSNLRTILAETRGALVVSIPKFIIYGPVTTAAALAARSKKAE